MLENKWRQNQMEEEKTIEANILLFLLEYELKRGSGNEDGWAVNELKALIKNPLVYGTKQMEAEENE